MSNRCFATTTASRQCRLHCVGNLKTCHVHAPECSVCLEKNGLSSRTLPCGHVFHGQCIGTWYTNDRRCPMCRHYDKPKLVKIFYEVGLERSADKEAIMVFLPDTLRHLEHRPHCSMMLSLSQPITWLIFLKTLRYSAR